MAAAKKRARSRPANTAASNGTGENQRYLDAANTLKEAIPLIMRDPNIKGRIPDGLQGFGKQFTAFHGWMGRNMKHFGVAPPAAEGQTTTKRASSKRTNVASKKRASKTLAAAG
jgi:hypothetical protein